MNKYSLHFISPNLEQKYQEHRYLSTIPACKAINLMCFSVCVLRSILSIVIQDYINVMIFSPLALLLLAVHFIVISYKKEWIDFYLVGINHLLMFYQIYTEDGFLPQEAYLFGQTMMGLHMTIILVSDFQYAVIQITMGAAIKLTIAQYFQSVISFQTYTYTVIIGLMIIFTLHRTNKQYRQSFLYTSNNNSLGIYLTILDWLIPIVIKNPFALCVYDSDNIGFQVKISNFAQHALFDPNYSNLENLNHLIRNYRIYGKTIEQFLISRRKALKRYYINKTLEIVNTKNHSDKIFIKYSEIFVTELTFVIIIDKREQEHQQLQMRTVRLERGVSNFIGNLKQFLKKQLKLINKQHSLSENQLYKSKMNLLYILTKLQINQPLNPKKFSLVHKITQFTKLYHLAYNQKIETQFNNELFKITTYKNVFDELMTLLMTFIYRQKTSYQSYEEFVDLRIILDQPSRLFLFLLKNTHFQKVIKMIGPHDKPLFENDSIIIRLYQDMTQIDQLVSFSK